MSIYEYQFSLKRIFSKNKIIQKSVKMVIPTGYELKYYKDF